MEGTDVLVLGVLGYALQWLRGFKWCNDGVTLLACSIGGAVSVLLAGPVADWRPFALAALKSTLAMLGGVKVASMAAQSGSPVLLAPKFNQFSEGK